MTIGIVRSVQASPESMASSPVDGSPTTKGRNSRRGMLIDAHIAAASVSAIYRIGPGCLGQTAALLKPAHTPPAGWSGRPRRDNSGRADLNAAHLLQPVDRVGERLRRIPLRDAEVTFGRGVI